MPSARSPLTNGKAYKIFLEELSKYLKKAASLLRKGEPAEKPEEECKSLGLSSHTLKGGAGFLGFPEIAARAGEIEALLLKSEESMSEKLDAARDLIREIEELAKDLPPAKIEGKEVSGA